MARIRSVHPGLWTDEQFVELSPFARLMLIGIWGECDDVGIFEWAPLKLKMRLLPGDNADAVALLDEMLRAKQVMRFEVAGRSYGAVRNFAKYQRPKKPNAVHPQTDEVLSFVGMEARSTRDGSEAVGNQLPTSGEKRRQMEDGGCKGSPVAKATAPIAPFDPSKMMFDAGIALLVEAGRSPPASRSLVGKWKASSSVETVMAAIGRAKREGAVDPAAFIEGCLRQKQRDGPVSNGLGMSVPC